MKAFELRSLPDRKKRRLYLVQLPYRTSVISEVTAPTTIAQLDGTQLDAASVLVLELVADKVGDIASNGSGEHILDRTFSAEIDEEIALRVGLLFAGIHSLRSEDRIQEIIAGVQQLDAAKAAFWLDGIARDASGNMLKAFRVAMTGEA